MLVNILHKSADSMEEAALFYCGSAQQEGVRLKKVRDIAEPIFFAHVELSVKGKNKKFDLEKSRKLNE